MGVVDRGVSRRQGPSHSSSQPVQVAHAVAWLPGAGSRVTGVHAQPAVQANRPVPASRAHVHGTSPSALVHRVRGVEGESS